MNLKLGLPPEVRDVVHRARDEIIDADDLVAAREQQIGQVRTEETGGAGHDGRGLFRLHEGKLASRLNAVKRSVVQRKAMQRLKAGPVHLAPVPASTTGMVRQIIFKSSHSDQLSMYSRSSRTQSLKSLTLIAPADLPEAGEAGLDAEAAAVGQVVESL